MGRSVYIVSAEPSGDALSVGLIRALRARDPDLTIHIIGGATVEAEGFISPIDVSPLSVLGFVEGVRILSTVNALALQTAKHVVDAKPDAVILVDSWGFMIRVAKLLDSQNLEGAVVKYVAPQVWAMRPGRAKVLARHVDHLLALHPFDAQYFQPQGLPTIHVGNPVLDTDFASGDGPAFRKRHHIAQSDPVLLVAFGSRRAEIERLADPFFAVIRALRSKHPGLAVIATTIPATRAQLMARLAVEDIDIITVEEDEKLDAYAASDFALAKSGTITTELADAGVPTVVAYKVSPITYWLARPIFKSKFISLVNVTAGVPLMPEFVQHKVVPATIAAQLEDWLANPKDARKLSHALRAVTDQMRGTGNAHTRAADAVLRVISTP